MVQSRHVAGDERWVAGVEPVPAGEHPERRPQTWVRRPRGADRSHPNRLPTVDTSISPRWLRLTMIGFFGIRSAGDSVATPEMGRVLSQKRSEPRKWPFMAEAASPDSVIGARRKRWPRGLGLLAVLLELALALRVLAAEAVEWYVRRGGLDRLCLFPDTKIYWELARAIRARAPYQIVDFGDIPHFALRAPGYPVVLAGCQALFGERTLAVRLVQAVLGTVSVYLVYRLCRQLAPSGSKAQPAEPEVGAEAGGGQSAVAVVRRSTALDGCSAPLIAAALAALNPYYIFMSVILLSEAVFEPLMLAALWGLAALWPCRSRESDGGPSLQEGRTGCPITGLKAALVSLGSGAAAGMAVLVRPSWVLFVPGALAVWVLAAIRARRGPDAARGPCSGFAAWCW